jgi:hypothetical protein
MKPLLFMLPFMLLFAIAVSAQSRSVQCTSAFAIAADPIPSGRTSPAAAKAVMEPPSKDAAAEPDSQSAKPRSNVGNVAAQIQLRRPGVPPSPWCRCGTVVAGSLTAPLDSQEVPILTGLAGSFRFDHVLVQETRRFSSDSVSSVDVGVGRAHLGADVVPPFPLKSDSAPDSFWNWRPNPPQLTGAYDLVLNFKASSPLGDGAASNFSSGALTWEVCGYNAQ